MAKLISMTKEIVEEFDVNNIVVFKQSSLVSNEQLEIANNLLTLFKIFKITATNIYFGLK